jgi:replication initiation protein RepC
VKKMEGGNVTTPFGRRPMTLGMLANQLAAKTIAPDKSVDKWKLFRALCEARAMIGVSDRALSVLDALLSFYPANELSEGRGLVVFPSNAQLSVRAHGMAPATLRRHLADLVHCGLIIRKDSPNGKRYARKSDDGEIGQVFGFSLAPLVVRAEEIEACAEQVRAEKRQIRITREHISICRRDIAKLIETAMEEAVPGNWQAIYLQFRGVVEGVARNAMLPELATTLDDLDMLREEILNILEMQLNSKKASANESQNERLIHNSNTQLISDLEPRFETKQGAKSDNIVMVEPGDTGSRDENWARDNKDWTKGSDAASPIRPFPLGLVLQACPQIVDYGPGGVVGNWRDLMSAAVVVRSVLGVSPSAYQEACAVMGPENAATVVACILERAGHINSAGGYLRDLTRRAERGEFGIGPMLMALAKANIPSGKKAG